MKKILSLTMVALLSTHMAHGMNPDDGSQGKGVLSWMNENRVPTALIALGTAAAGTGLVWAGKKLYNRWFSAETTQSLEAKLQELHQNLSKLSAESQELINLRDSLLQACHNHPEQLSEEDQLAFFQLNDQIMGQQQIIVALQQEWQTTAQQIEALQGCDKASSSAPKPTQPTAAPSAAPAVPSQEELGRQAALQLQEDALRQEEALRLQLQTRFVEIENEITAMTQQISEYDSRFVELSQIEHPTEAQANEIAELGRQTNELADLIKVLTADKEQIAVALR